MTMPANTRVCRFKVVLLGDPEVGKTSLIQRYVSHAFSEVYQKTIGMSVAKHPEFFIMDGFGSIEVQLTIWDIMGQRPSLELLHGAYFEGAKGALAVFDVTRRKSFEAVRYWVEQVRKVEPRMPILVIGNKTDLVDRQDVSDEEAREGCKAMGLAYLPASAKTGLNVEAAFGRLAQDVFVAFSPPESRARAA